MEQNNTIREALNILKNRDWAWEMADDNFTGRYAKAKAEMKRFVAMVNMIDNNEIREALRRYWTLCYNRLHAAYVGKEFNEEAELDNLKNRFAYAA